MSIFSFWRRKQSTTLSSNAPTASTPPLATLPKAQAELPYKFDIRRHFYNQPRFQCYASFFAYWGGWISAGHCLTDTNDMPPPFASGDLLSWPEGLDAALIGVTLPGTRPADPVIGQKVTCLGYPAGSRIMELRHAKVYIERGKGSGTWIAHIREPDEPVVTGMSGGPVIDALTGQPLGIIITRNSPADLNNDRDPDESCDFIALSSVWDAVARQQNFS